MTNLRPTINEAKRRREELRAELYDLLETLEGRPLRRQATSPFPFNWLESAIKRGFAQLERVAASIADAALRRVPIMKRQR